MKVQVGESNTPRAVLIKAEATRHLLISMIFRQNNSRKRSFIYLFTYLFYIILFYFILFYFILFYFILFYFILFYFILFYFILSVPQSNTPWAASASRKATRREKIWER